MQLCFVSSGHSIAEAREFYSGTRSLPDPEVELTHVGPGAPQEAGVFGGVTFVTCPPATGLEDRVAELATLYSLAAKQGADVYYCSEDEPWAVSVVLGILGARRNAFTAHVVVPEAFAERRCPSPTWAVLRNGSGRVRRLSAPWHEGFVVARRSHLSRFFPPHVVDPDGEQGASEPTRGDTAGGRVLHSGALDRRTWPVLVSALGQPSAGELTVDVVGATGDGSEDEFEAALHELRLGPRLRVHPWKTGLELACMVRAADVGLLLGEPGRPRRITLPQALFDAMAAGLPVVAPEFAPELAEVVRGAECGVLVDTRDPCAVAEALAELARSDVGRAMGERGRRALEDGRYTWARRGLVLVDYFRGLAAGLPRHVPSLTDLALQDAMGRAGRRA